MYLPMRHLVTGSSGFVGAFVAKALLERWEEVIGIDIENDYYDPTLKQRRRSQLETFPQYRFHQLDLADRKALTELFDQYQIEKVCHLAAQAGVRYSLDNPHAYIQSNLVGFHHLLYLANEHQVDTFVYASSSSVYGLTEQQPSSVTQRVDHPISLYAATKKSNELIAHTYSHLYGLSTVWLRFFTVYGPAGRPDMAYYKFADLARKGQTIDIYNHGDMMRDFTYIDDIVDGILKALSYETDYAIFNLGNDQPEKLMDMISYLEDALEVTFEKNYLPMQPGDVYKTWSDIDLTKQELDRQPTTSLEDGLDKFAEWYRSYHGLTKQPSVSLHERLLGTSNQTTVDA